MSLPITVNATIPKGYPYDSAGYGAYFLDANTVELLPKITFEERKYLDNVQHGFKVIIKDVSPVRIEQYDKQFDKWKIIVSPYVEPPFSSGSTYPLPDPASGPGKIVSSNGTEYILVDPSIGQSSYVTTYSGAGPSFTITHGLNANHVSSYIFDSTGEQLLAKVLPDNTDAKNKVVVTYGYGLPITAAHTIIITALN